MNKKADGEIGKLLTTFPVVLIVFLIMGGFILIVALSKLQMDPISNTLSDQGYIGDSFIFDTITAKQKDWPEPKKLLIFDFILSEQRGIDYGGTDSLIKELEKRNLEKENGKKNCVYLRIQGDPFTIIGELENGKFTQTNQLVFRSANSGYSPIHFVNLNTGKQLQFYYGDCESYARIGK
jgi:hypothetical protein